MNWLLTCEAYIISDKTIIILCIHSDDNLFNAVKATNKIPLTLYSMLSLAKLCCDIFTAIQPLAVTLC